MSRAKRASIQFGQSARRVFAPIVAPVGRAARTVTQPMGRAAKAVSRRTTATYDHVPRWIRQAFAVVCVALVGLLLGIELGAHGTYNIGPLDVRMSLHPSLHGGSRVEIPPLGALEAHTHDGPAQLSARVDQLDAAQAKQIVRDPSRIESESKKAVPQLTSALENLIFRAVLVGVASAFLLGLIFFRRVRRALLTGGVALAMLAVTLGIGWGTSHPENIREPRYEGLLTNVPAVIGDANSIYQNFGAYQGELVKLVTNMSHIYTNLSSLPDYQPNPDTVRVLHVSDLHLNPASFDVIRTIAEQFKAQLIIDTGDITDWGSEQENQYIADNYVSSIGTLGVPYLYVRGNHDSAATAEAIAKQPNAVVLEDAITQVDGLTIAGIGDPRHTPDKSNGDNGKDETQVVAASKELAKTVKTHNRTNADTVDIDMIHDPAGALPLKDTAPLILAGHMHKRATKKLDDATTLKVEGSTGAAGLRGLYHKKTTPFEMSMLYFDKNSGALQAYDAITISGIGQSDIDLQRTIVQPAQ